MNTRIEHDTMGEIAVPADRHWGANSVTAEFDPERELFWVRYAQKRTEDFGVLETRGLGRFRFSPWKP